MLPIYLNPNKKKEIFVQLPTKLIGENVLLRTYT